MFDVAGVGVFRTNRFDLDEILHNNVAKQQIPQGEVLVCGK
jgi:hypothetical protein